MTYQFNANVPLNSTILGRDTQPFLEGSRDTRPEASMAVNQVLITCGIIPDRLHDHIKQFDN